MKIISLFPTRLVSAEITEFTYRRERQREKAFAGYGLSSSQDLVV